MILDLEFMLRMEMITQTSDVEMGRKMLPDKRLGCLLESMFDLKTICCVSVTFSPLPRVPLCIHTAAVWHITEWQMTGLNCFKTPSSALQKVNSSENFPWTRSLLLRKFWLTVWDQNLFWEHWTHSHYMSYKFSHGRLKHWVSVWWMGVGDCGSGKPRDQGL